MASGDSTVWSNSLARLPKISLSSVEFIAQKHTVTHKNSTQKGYKFFWDSFVHDVEVRSCADGHKVRAKCYHSMQKTGKHSLWMKLTDKDRVDAESYECSCTAGHGMCQHQIALLFVLNHYQNLNLKKVPEIVSKTSAVQQWHVPPRTHGFTNRPVSDVRVIKPVKPATSDGDSPAPKRKRVEAGVASKLWNPVPMPLSVIHDMTVNQLLPTLKKQEKPVRWMRIWNASDTNPLVDSAFGPVVRGSLISQQQKLKPEKVFIGPHTPPDFDLPRLPFPIDETLLTEKELVVFTGLKTTLVESLQYEGDTRSQSENPEWFKLRKHRLTASKFRMVSSRRGKFDALANDLLTKKNVTTAAMQYGIDNESKAVSEYARLYCVDTHPVGFVINPSAPHLGCTPDRRVFDPDAESQWGLLEVKCSTKDTLAEVACLKETDSGFKLNRAHPYWNQVIGQMGLTGSEWCDFFLMCQDTYFCERVHFDEQGFAEMKQKLDEFFVKHYLPAIVKHLK